MNQKKVFKTLAILLIFTSSSILHAQHVSEGSICQALAYLGESNSEIVLKSSPNISSAPVAKLKHNQYVCITRTEGDWAMVRKVRPMSGSNIQICDEENKKCVNIGDFPATKHKKNYRNSCTLKQSFDSEENIIISTKGKCINGWIKRDSLRYFAD